MYLDLSSFKCRLLIYRSVFGAGFDKTLNHFVTTVLMGHFTSFETQTNSYLVSFAEELDGTAHLCVKVVSFDPAGKLNLFDFNGLLLLSVFLFFLVTFITVFTVIHDTAYGGLCLRSDKGNIETLVICILSCGINVHNTHGVIVFVENTDFLYPNIVVDEKFFSADKAAPPKIKNVRETQFSAQQITQIQFESEIY